MKEVKEVRVGVVGFCLPTRFDEVEARRLIRSAYSEVVSLFSDCRIIVVSGLINVGIPAIAYNEACVHGWRTIGVACKRATKHPLFPVNEKIIVGNEWGQESPVFLALLNAMIRVGGGKQSLAETEAIKAKGFPVWEYDLPAIK
ncbi:MAG: hypothetical protein WC757_02395 [Candidatus Paceibacterota bacterium]|jgi:hypothetical protein